MNRIILSCSFANETVTAKSYKALKDTTAINPCEVWIWDNHYPLNNPDFVRNICVENGWKYMHAGENVGLYEAYRRLQFHLKEFADDPKTVIFYDGDNNPKVNNWHLALFTVMENENIACATLLNQVNNRELRERGFDFDNVDGVRVLVTKSACTNTVCAFDMPFLNAAGGLQGKYYYGGNEVNLWPHFKNRKWVFLADFWENKEEIDCLHDWQYTQYKMLYAHKGLDMSFADYLKTNPQKINNIKQYIWG